MQAEYEKCVQYNTGLGLYEDVKQCENFVEGKQWEGLKSKNLRPITMNVLDPTPANTAMPVVLAISPVMRSFRTSRPSMRRKSLSRALIVWLSEQN